MRARLLFFPVLLISCVLSAQEIGVVRELKQLWKYDEAITLGREVLQRAFAPGTRGREIADSRVAHITAELFMEEKK